MKTSGPAIVFVAALFAAVSFGGLAAAAPLIPLGSYAISEEVCKLSGDDTTSMADFRSRFGSDAVLDVTKDHLTFAAIPAYCDIVNPKQENSTTIKAKAECNVAGATEDVIFSFELKTNRLSVRVSKGPSDGWFSPDFHKDYILCPKN